MGGVRISKTDRRGAFSSKLLILGTLSFTLADPARAQSVNYAELEEMFGEPVTTSVTGKPQRASEAPASLIIVTRDEIRRSPADDVPGLLKAYAGIDVSRWTAFQDDVTIRGGVRPMNPGLLVLVNGRKVFFDYYNTTNWKNLGVQLEEIQQIEVVKGPSSALFGFNASTGVVNIITVNPLQTEQASVTVEGWPGENLRASAAFAGKLGEGLGLRLSAGYEEREELDRARATGFLPLNTQLHDLDRKEASGELYAAIDDATNLSLSLSYSDSFEHQVTPPQIMVRGDNRSVLADLQLSRDMGWGMLSGHIGKSWVDIRSDISFTLPLLPFVDTDTFIAGADALVRADPSNVVRLGVEYRKLSFVADSGYSSATKYEVLSGSAMWEGQLNDALRVTLAGRLDHLKLWQDGALDKPTIYTRDDYDRSFMEWNVNAAFFAKLNEESSLRVAAGRGTQVPSLMELGWNLSFPVPGLSVPIALAGNPRLNPIAVSSIEVGYVRSLAAIDTQLELTAFYTHSDGLVALPLVNGLPEATPPSRPFILFTSRDVGKVSSYGLEASLKGTIAPNWSWMLNYNWTKADGDIPDNRGGSIQYPYLLDTSTPEHKVNAQLSYERGPWLGTLLARYISATTQPAGLLGTYIPARVNVRESLAFDAKISVRLSEHATVSLAGENLTGASGAGLSQFPAERRLRASLQLRL